MMAFLVKTSNSWLKSFWKFSRPHTIIGTSLSVFALYAIALSLTSTSISIANLVVCLATWLVCLAGNIYIVGLNQLEDVAIDKINKPHLPLAAAEFSPQTAWGIVGVCGAFAVVFAAILGNYLLFTVVISLLIGTAYSLPPIRLKRYPLWAALCIFSVRGVIVNLGIFSHFQAQLSSNQGLPPVIWLLTLFILIFTIAIAIFKDVPDLEGDRQYQITTLTLILGKKAVFNLSLGIITCSYLGMIVAAFFPLFQVNQLLLGLIHLVLLILLWLRSFKVDLEQKQEIRDFYQFIWKLFFLEYLFFPLACIFSPTLT
ncbi:homogentisate phytyltransferase [Gloeocapsa sp. PCC 73106]|uniref:homogentisate phytyltransferase n=1 Tax=Gloeocapsa sp. PCC 73106 TaxID=102232 RepID=UPI0002AC05DB|nr:homogentisate phytyltransferase [Gloeocapsa sp. PCC 73106]ELR98642.1 4-hydroxybenzoate polyprenyltransferase-like prenyltransferase [Gloeocapsa sp. PCC 73106]